MKEKNFKFKEGYYKVVKEMTDKQAGEFIKGICAYAFDSKDFTTKDSYLKGVFMYMQKSLDEASRGREYGKISAIMKKAKEQDVIGGVVITFDGDKA